MLAIIILSIGICTILFFILKRAFEAHSRDEIVIYYDGWDLAFNIMAYIIPLILIIFIDASQMNQTIFYFSTCIGFTILMGISAYQNNPDKFLMVLFIKICIGIEAIAILIASVAVLVSIPSLDFNKKNNRKGM